MSLDYSLMTAAPVDFPGIPIRDFLGRNTNINFKTCQSLFRKYEEILLDIFPMFMFPPSRHNIMEKDYVLLLSTRYVKQEMTVGYYTKNFHIENLTLNLHFSELQARLEIFFGSFENNVELFRYNTIHTQKMNVINPDYIFCCDNELKNSIYNFVELLR